MTGILDIGRYPSGADGLTEEVAAAFRGSTFHADVRPDIMRWKYRKLLLNLGNAVEALCGSAGRGSGLVEQARREGVECLNAAGIEFASDEEEPARRERQLGLQPIDGQKRPGGSSWQSLERGTRSIEADYLNGEIVLLGRTYGVSTPVNELLQRLATQAAREGKPPGSLSTAAIAEDLKREPKH
jgi:2-dehydropantoate 2-reductase